MEIHDNHMSKSFDNDFEKLSDKLNWYPWVGSQYESSKNKILVLGESHYDWNDENKNYNESKDMLANKSFTRHVVSEQGLAHLCKLKIQNRKLFRNLERFFFNLDYVDNDKKLKLWESASYMNLVQDVMSTINERPLEKQYKYGWQTVQKVVDIINPNFILVLGTEYSKIKTFQEVYKAEVEWSSERIGRSYRKRSKIADIKVEFIRHPSAYFSWSRWHEVVKNEELLSF